MSMEKKERPLSELVKELDKVLENDVANRHSYFQMQYFIIGREPTVQAKMWQCLRELRSRRETIQQLRLDLEEAFDTDRLLHIQLERKSQSSIMAESLETEQETKWQTEEQRIACRQIMRKRITLHNGIRELEKKLRFASEEAAFFLDMFTQLEATTPLKPFDDLSSQKEYWQERLANEIHMRALLSQPMDPELMKTTLALPDGLPIKKDMITMLNNITTKMIQRRQEKEPEPHDSN